MAAAKKVTKAEKAEALQAEWDALVEAMGTDNVEEMVEFFQRHEDQVRWSQLLSGSLTWQSWCTGNGRGGGEGRRS